MLLQAGPEFAEAYLHCSMEGYGNAGKDLVLFWGSGSFLLKQFSIAEHSSGGVTLSALSELAGLNLTLVCLVIFNCFSGFSTDQSPRKFKDCKTGKFCPKVSRPQSSAFPPKHFCSLGLSEIPPSKTIDGVSVLGYSQVHQCSHRALS